MENSTIFGPVNSRRFGVSLGIDLSPAFKQCNFDCLYCELAPSITIPKQQQSVNVEDIVTELKKHLKDDIDVITLTANGEPTLYPHLDKLIDEIDKLKGNTQTLILTNSATLTDKKIFNTLLKLDQVKLSLDAISEDIFKKIDRPDKSIDIKNITKAISEFSKVFKGRLFIEILFVDTLNNKPQEVKKLSEFLKTIECERIDIGTIDRPPAYGVKGISYEELFELSKLFDSSLNIHIASRKNISTKPKHYTADEILNTLEKRPLTKEDIDILFDEKSKDILTTLVNEKKITIKTINHIDFFKKA